MRTIRSIALLLNALFPFLLPLRNWLNGRILLGFIRFIRDAYAYLRAEQKAQSGFKLKLTSFYPCLIDRYEEAGRITRHYFWQDLWAAQKVCASKVPRHYDIGSRLDGFITHCLPFCEVVMLDIRPLGVSIKNLSFIQANGMDMPAIADDSLDSFSSLHAVEHFGLGRYGDPIDPTGYRKAIKEIQRVVKPGGSIYFSVPIGVERLEFNGHRVFNPHTILALFDRCELVEFSLIDDRNSFHEKVDPGNYCDLQYGCGLFHFHKRPEPNQVQRAAKL